MLNLLSKIQEFLSKKFYQVPKPSGTHKNNGPSRAKLKGCPYFVKYEDCFYD